MHELILGGQKSGKSRAAEARAEVWLAGRGRDATLLATAAALDAEMATRIERHRHDRARRVPTLVTVEVTGDLAAAIDASTSPSTLLIVDCLTLWLTQRLMPLNGDAVGDLDRQVDALIAALDHATGPLVLVSNEIAMGVVSTDRDTRRFVDALGLLHQRVATACARVTLVVAGCELAMKETR